MLYELTKSGKLAKHVEVIKKDYRAKRDLMIQTMRQHFPPGIKWTEPEGGMFLWVTLPEHMSAKELMPKAIDLKVAYVYGQPFFPNEDKGANTLRLNFSNATHENIVEGIKRLAQLFADHM